jgi:hypothetical protein
MSTYPGEPRDAQHGHVPCFHRVDMVLHLHLPIMRLHHHRPANNPHHLQVGVHLHHPIALQTHTLPTGTCWSARSSSSLCILSSLISHATLGHSLGTISIRRSLKNGQRVSNSNTINTMLSRGMARMGHQGHRLHRRMGFPRRPRLWGSAIRCGRTYEHASVRVMINNGFVLVGR